MPSLSDFGIVSIATALVKNFKLRKTTEVPEPVLKSTGLFHQSATSGADYTFEGDGEGDLPGDFALGGNATGNISGLSGGVTIVFSAGENQALNRHNTWRASGEHAPAAD